jgi:hypothetical protein
VFTFRAAPGAAILHEGPDLLDLFRGEHTSCGEQRFHLLFLHLSSQRVHLIKFLHDRVVIRIIRAKKFTEFNVAQLHICASLHGSFLRLYADLVQASNLLVRETEKHAYARIFCHAQQVLAAAEFVPSAAFPATVLALFRPAEFTPAAFRELMRAATPFVRSATTKLMLALPWAGPFWGAILSPTDHRCRQQNHKS